MLSARTRRNAPVVLGIAILASIVAAAAWVRTGSTAASGIAPGTALPDVTMADASVDVGHLRLVLSIDPHPPYAFEKMHVRVRAEDRSGAAKGAVSLQDARVSFEMRMPMGEHRYRLAPGAGGWLEADVVLPMCGSGDARWFAIVEAGPAGGKPVRGRFQLDLAKIDR